MSTFRELTYLILDEIKTVSDDSMITEEHVLFLANHYRNLLLEQKLKLDKYLSESNQLILCVDLHKVAAVDGEAACYGEYLKSTKLIPTTITGTVKTASAGDLFLDNITIVSKNRFKYVGYNKYLKNIIYAAIGDDRYLYLKSNNPLFLYLKLVLVSGVFEDATQAAEMSCNKDGSVEDCEVWDKPFPLDSSLIPQLTLLVVKDLLGAAWRASNDINNALDDLANLMAYIRRNLKNNLQKQIDPNES